MPDRGRPGRVVEETGHLVGARVTSGLIQRGGLSRDETFQRGQHRALARLISTGLFWPLQQGAVHAKTGGNLATSTATGSPGGKRMSIEAPEAATRIALDEGELPTRWYNIQADLPFPPSPPIHPGTKQPIGPADLAPLFPMELIKQEVSQERYIDIPRPALEALQLWR